MRIRLGELKRIIEAEVRRSRVMFGETSCSRDDMIESDGGDEKHDDRKKRRPTPRIPKRGRHGINTRNVKTKRKLATAGGSRADEVLTHRSRRFTESLGSRRDLELELIDALDYLDDEEQWGRADDAAAAAHSVELAIDALVDAGYSDDDIFDIDPRTVNHM